METPTEKKINDRVDTWHKGPNTNKTLCDFMGWSWDEYKLFVERNIWPEREYVPIVYTDVWSNDMMEKYGTVRWFGPYKNVGPFNRPEAKIDPPLGKSCDCGKVFRVGDTGVALPFLVPDDPHSFLAYHHACFRKLLTDDPSEASHAYETHDVPC